MDDTTEKVLLDGNLDMNFSFEDVIKGAVETWKEVIIMAHAFCPNGHGMWNGDGKPVVWAFRVGYFRDFMKAHPDCKLDEGSEYWQLYDCVDDVPGEDLDCWYCDECKGLVVYVDIVRYDFKRMENVPDINPDDLAGWEDYIAMRDREFEEFQEFYEGKSPMEAIEQYSFIYRYKLSPDKKTFYALDKDGRIVFGYFKSNYTEFSPETEIRFGTDGDSVPYRPYEWEKRENGYQCSPRSVCLYKRWT